MMTIDAAELRNWFDNQSWYFNIDRGYYGSSGPALTEFEVDGYLYIDACTGGNCVGGISVPWHVLPRPVADSTVKANLGKQTVTFSNTSPVVDNNVDLFALIDQDANDYEAIVGDCASLGLGPGCNTTLPDIKEVGVRDGAYGPYLEFAVTFWNEPFFASQFPVEIDIYIDTNRDGIDDYVVYNYELNSSAITGNNVVKIYDLSTDTVSIYTYTDSTFNSNNYILPLPQAAIGLVAGQSFDFAVFAFDGYFTGALSDCAPKGSDYCKTATYTYTMGSQRYIPESWLLMVPAKDSAVVNFMKNSTAVTSQTGLLALYREASVGKESYAVRLDGTDTKALYDLYFPLLRK